MGKITTFRPIILKTVTAASPGRGPESPDPFL